MERWAKNILFIVTEDPKEEGGGGEQVSTI